MVQHMLQYAMTGQHPKPMPARDNPWAIYDVFTVADDEQIFLAAVSDGQWKVFCDVLNLQDLVNRPELATNNDRVRVRPWLLETLRERLRHRRANELAEIMEQAGLPFAPIRRPEDLLEDEHLIATGGLADVRVADGEMAGQMVKATLAPFTLGGQRLPVRLLPPKFAEHTNEVLGSLGMTEAEIDRLREAGTVS